MRGMIEWSCGQCGAVQSMTPETNRVLRQSSQTFYCVHGHARHYPQGKSREEKLEESLNKEIRARQRAEQNAAYHAEQRGTAERSASAYKGQATRLRSRVKAGVCPCCNRTFKQLAAHMADKHPGFESESSPLT